MRALPSVFVLSLPFPLLSNHRRSDLSPTGRQNAFLSALLKIHESLLMQRPVIPFLKEQGLQGSKFVNRGK